MEKWAELRTAYQVARLGTVSAAATQLGFHRATVNRHIDALEEEIGARIFIRHARGYALTEVGEDVLRVAQKTEALFDDLTGRVRGGKAEIEGEIKLTIVAPFVGLLMEPITAFRKENPNCRVAIDATDDLARLEFGEAHIALRAGSKPDHPDYVVASLGRVAFNLFAHESYIERFGFPQDTDAIAAHRFVIPNETEARVPFWPWIKENVQPEMIALNSCSPSVNLEAICSGIGIGFIGVHEANMRGGFQPVFPPNRAWSVPLWLVTHVDLHRTEKVQAMLACIKASPLEPA